MAGRTKTAEKLTPGGWLRVYWLCFGACLLVAAALLAFAPRLAQYGLTGYLVYLVLVPLGLGAAGFLSGAMRSLARYEGKLWFGALRLGGPVVVFGLVVLGGFFLGQPAGTLQLAVRVYGPGGSGDVVRRGSVRLIVGQATLVAPIDGNGAAYFPEVPAKFRGQPVAIEPEVEGYRARDPGPRPLPADGVLRLDLEKTVRSTTAAGTVLATDGRPVAGASVNLESGLAVGTTDGLGNFKLEVKGAEKDRLRLIVVDRGRVGFDEYVVPPGPWTIVLQE